MCDNEKNVVFFEKLIHHPFALRLSFRRHTCGPLLWNDLRTHLKMVQSLSQFKSS